jgi:hypothetical protein
MVRSAHLARVSNHEAPMPPSFETPHLAVVARLARAIQYSRDSRDKSRRRGVLDHPPSRVMTDERGDAGGSRYFGNRNEAGTPVVEEVMDRCDE